MIYKCYIYKYMNNNMNTTNRLHPIYNTEEVIKINDELNSIRKNIIKLGKDLYSIKEYKKEVRRLDTNYKNNIISIICDNDNDDDYVKSYLPVWRAWPGIIKEQLDKQNKLIEENNKLISELNDRINNLVNKKFAIWSGINI